jgi:hypothetical protein
VSPNDEDENPIASQSRYRSGLGTLLYFIKNSRTDLANAVHELSKCMDGASIAAYKDDQSDQICVGYKRYLFEVEAQPG